VVLAIIAFRRFIFNIYLMMTTSTIVTKISPLMAKTVQSWKRCGSINHKIGNVHVDASIPVNIILQFFILSCLKKSLQRKIKTIVSNVIVSNRDLRNSKKYMNYCMNKILLIIYCDYGYFFNINFEKNEFTTTSPPLRGPPLLSEREFLP
jgi:hypothetical protein